uniref:Uncharacterized protein n=1 Tax=Aegilops tauschii subsp. strangulata TaxID=200361 RepID=A0A453F566_AEGTS
FGLPKYKFDAQFNGVEQNAEKCGHVISPARRVATEGNNRRFLGCPYESGLIQNGREGKRL